MWWGALSGVGLALALGVVFICLFWVARNSVFDGEGKIIFEGFLFLLAGWLNVLMAIALLKPPALAAFLLAGFALEVVGLALLIRGHLPERERS